MSERAYLRDGAAIYERSFAIIRAEADLSHFSAEEADVAVRMIHACGQVDMAQYFVFGGGLVAAALVMLLFLQIRAVTYNGGTWGEAFKTLSVVSNSGRIATSVAKRNKSTELHGLRSLLHIGLQDGLDLLRRHGNRRNARPFLLQQRTHPGITRAPAAIQRLGQFHQRHVGQAHRHLHLPR